MTAFKAFINNPVSMHRHFFVVLMFSLFLFSSCQESAKEEGASSGAPGTVNGLPFVPNTWNMELTSHNETTTYGSTLLFYQQIKGKATASKGVSGFVQIHWETYVGGTLRHSGTGGWLKTIKNGDSFYGEWIIPSAKLVDTSLNTVRIIASDQIGNKVYKEITVSVDATKPTLNVTAPSNLSQTSTYWTNDPDITIAGNASDNILVSSADWTNTTNAATGALMPYAGFSAVIPLNIGDNEIELEALDPSSNSTLKTYTVHREIIAPAISFTAPTTGTTFYSNVVAPFTLAGDLVEVDSGLDSISWANSATGASGTIALGATFSVPNIVVVAGINPITISATDRAGNTGTATLNYIVSLSAPVITAASFTLNGGAASTTNSTISINLQATDSLVPVSDVCFKVNNKTPPGLSDPCWIAKTPNQNLSVVGQSFSLGKLSLVYNVYAWARNQVGNISTLSNSGDGTLARDRAKIEYLPSAPPVLSGLVVANTDIPSAPVTVAQLSTATTPIFIKWKASDVAGLTGAPIKITHTTDFKTFTTVAAGLVNGANGTCTIDHASTTIDDGYTGCYRWTTAVPASTVKFFVRVEVTDNDGQQSTAAGPAMNTAGSLWQVGNMDGGIAAHATALSTVTRNTNHTTNLVYHDANTFVVRNNGDIFVLDNYKGIIKVDMATGISSLYAATDTTAAAGAGDNGPVSAAKLKMPLKLALDHSDNLYVLDFNRIRRINLATNTIITLIGGGTNTAAVVTDPLTLQMGPFDLTTIDFDYTMLSMTIAPNGDMIFTEKTNVFDYSPNGGFYLRYYDASSGEISKITPSGIGTQSNPTVDVATCRTWQSGFEYDLVSGEFSDAFFKTYTTGGFPDCPFSMYRAQVGTWVSTGPHIDGSGSYLIYGKLITGQNGRIYMMDRWYPSIHLWDTDTGAWSKLAGNNNARGECDDGTIGISCNIDPIDTFITKEGEVYIREVNRIRRIDSSGRLRTVTGQPAKNSYGNSALTSKLGYAQSFGTWKSGSIWKFGYLDGQNYTLLATDPAGATTHLSGNGIQGNATDGVDARTLPFRAWGHGQQYQHGIVQDTANGDIYMSAHSGWIARMTQGTTTWTRIIGGGATGIQDPSADGTVGTGVANTGYVLVPLAFYNNKLMVHYSYYNGGYMNQIKLYDKADSWRQSHLSGNNTQATTVTWAADGTPTSTGMVGWAFSAGNGYYNAFNSNWYTVTDYASGGNMAAHILNPGGNLASAQFNHWPQSIAGKHDASNNIVYLCDSYSGKLWKRNVTGGTEVEVVLEAPFTDKVRCDTGRSLIYNAERNTLIIGADFQGAYGLLEIPAP